MQQKMPQAPYHVPSHPQRNSQASQWASRLAFLSFLPSSLGPQPRGKFLPQHSAFHVAGADSVRTSADYHPLPPTPHPKSSGPHLILFPKRPALGTATAGGCSELRPAIRGAQAAVGRHSAHDLTKVFEFQVARAREP